MGIDVNIPSFSDYPTKPPPPVSPPPHRDYQRNKNQTIPTTTTKDQDFDSEIPTITTKDQAIDVPQDFSWFTFDTTTATTTATTADQNRNQDSSEMTLEEEFQQWEEEHYEAEDRAEQAAWPKSKWEILAATRNANIYTPIKATTTATSTENDDANAATDTDTDTTTHMPTMIEENSTPLDADDTTIEEAEEQKQHTRPITVISNKNSNTNKNKNKKKKIQKKPTLKMTHIPAIIEEEEEEEEVPIPPSMCDITNEFTTRTIHDSTTTIDDATLDDELTTSTTIPEEDPPVTDNTTITEDDEEISIPSSNFDIDDDFTTSKSNHDEIHAMIEHTTIDDDTPGFTTNNSNITSTVNVNIIDDDSYIEKSNNFYDNIDNEILQTEYDGTIVFEDCVDDEEPTTENVVTANSNSNINIAQRLAEDVGQAATCAAEREQREEDRVDKARVHEEERAAERAQRKEDRVARARVREEERARNGQKRARWLDELKTCLTTGCPSIDNSPASTPHTCIEIPSETTSETTKEVPTIIKSITNTSNSNKHHTINLRVAHQNTVSYDKWRQQQEQQQAQTLQKTNEYWDAECYRQLAAAEKEAELDHGEDDTEPIAGHHDESESESSHETIPPTFDWNNNEDDEYYNEYDNVYDEYNSVHTTDNIDINTITDIPIVTPTTNTIIESPIYSEINIIEDEDKYDPNNSIKHKNAAKKKEKAARRKNAVSIRRTENTIRNKFFEFLDHEGSNDSDSSRSECNCDLHHDCPKHRWEHWSQRTFSYDKTYNYDRVDPVETYMLDGQDHWYFNSYIPRMLGGFMPH
eukprot:CAMPEP_0170809312 /NCGR_PEP_ID=MMETSP0733-20121128/33953_1 /TAXON_ID=186038 /ORGANISM="Fragilariopsis kerguelensis, Strain L26-C5" /LENGTH=808 /DNA_ID=CAMNT_0011164985 /DNA_START=53 /DNA_END=2479 /DNA_ORIENTATION=+